MKSKCQIEDYVPAGLQRNRGVVLPAATQQRWRATAATQQRWRATSNYLGKKLRQFLVNRI